MWRSQRDHFFVREARATTRTIVAVGVLVQTAIVAILIAAGYPTWRIAATIGIYAGFVLGHRLILLSTRDPHGVTRAFIGMNVVAQLYVVGSCAVTGGIHSPLLFGTAMPAIVSLLFFGPQAVSRWMALANGLLVVAMVALPPSLVGPALPGMSYAAAVLLNLTWNLFMLHMMVGKLTAIAAQTSESFADLREERLADAEAQLRRLESVGAKVAHELKNPLASIKGLCQLVARDPNNNRTPERLAVAASEISRMESILAEYLSFSRPLEDLKPEAVEIVELSRDVLEVLAGRADQAGVALSLDGAATTIEGDPRRLKEALINLVANAIEATPHGGTVALRVRAGDADVVVEVRDTGRGIAPDDLARLGTSFFTTRPTGTGLGVVLAQAVITQHGGSLGYASALGRGTVATIKLPMSAAASPEQRGGVAESTCA